MTTVHSSQRDTQSGTRRESVRHAHTHTYKLQLPQFSPTDPVSFYRREREREQRVEMRVRYEWAGARSGTYLRDTYAPGVLQL